MTMKSEFWTALAQLAATMAAAEGHLTHKEQLQIIATEFACATANRRRDMRLALWAVITFLEDLSALIPRSP
jgi:hypothetical protein